MDQNSGVNSSRRKFLFNSGKSLAALAAANVGVYAVGSVFKKLDGSLVAGAKSYSCVCNPDCSGGFFSCSGASTTSSATDVTGNVCGAYTTSFFGAPIWRVWACN